MPLPGPGHHENSDNPADRQNQAAAEIEPSEVFLRKLGKRIRELRQEKGLTQEDFDDQTPVGISSNGL